MNESLITTQNLVKYYPVAGGMKTPALNGVSFDIRKGEFVAIMGPSGSGKSTLLALLGTLDRPSEGVYLLDGKDVNAMDDDALVDTRRHVIGFVFQHYNLLPRCSVLHNMLLPARYAARHGSATTQQALKLLERVGLAGYENRMPPTLSGGQQQRVAIARALMHQPALILADEPTGNLDTASSDDMMALLRGIHAEGQTIILVTHDPEIAHYADRLIEMKDGRIVHDGAVKKNTPGATP